MTDALKKMVRFMLKNYDQSRVSDMYLAAMIWRYERGPDFGKVSEFAFLGDLANMKGLSHFKDIVKASIECKKENPNLKLTEIQQRKYGKR